MHARYDRGVGGDTIGVQAGAGRERMPQNHGDKRLVFLGQLVEEGGEMLMQKTQWLTVSMWCESRGTF